MSAVYRQLLEQFGTGWERGDVDAIAAVFAPDAVFLGSPFGERTAGIDAIRAYWKDVPLNQAEATFKAGEVHAAGPWFAAAGIDPFARAAPPGRAGKHGSEPGPGRVDLAGLERGLRLVQGDVLPVCPDGVDPRSALAERRAEEHGVGGDRKSTRLHIAA